MKKTGWDLQGKDFWTLFLRLLVVILSGVGNWLMLLFLKLAQFWLHALSIRRKNTEEWTGIPNEYRSNLTAGKLPVPGGYLQAEKEHGGKHPARRFDAVPQGLPANNRNCPASGQRRRRAAGGGDHQGPPSLHLYHF